MCSAAAAQGFVGSDPGRVHVTTHQATLRRHPTCHNQKNLQLRYTAMYQRGFGEIKQKKKKEKDYEFTLVIALDRLLSGWTI